MFPHFVVEEKHNSAHARGFTLLELLIVCAIITILALITLDYMGDSKKKGIDAGIKSDLKNAQSQAEVYFLNNNRSYEGVCNDSTNGIFRHMRSAGLKFDSTPTTPYDPSPHTGSAWDREACQDSTTQYAAWAPLRDSVNGAPVGWCIDSQNAARRVTDTLDPAPPPGPQPYRFQCPP